MQVLKKLPVTLPCHAVFTAGGTGETPRPEKQPGIQPGGQISEQPGDQPGEQSGDQPGELPGKQPQELPEKQPAKLSCHKRLAGMWMLRDRALRRKVILKEQMLLQRPEKAAMSMDKKPTDKKPAGQNRTDQKPAGRPHCQPVLPGLERHTEKQQTEKQHTEEQSMREQQKNTQQINTRHGKSQRGFTLIEVLGALVVGSLVFGFAAFAISKAIESARVTSFSENLALLRINVHEVYASSRGFGSSSATAKDITSTLAEAGAIPDPWLDKDSNTVMHTLGGEVSIEGTLTGFTISAKDITQDACRKIASSQKENWDKVTINGETVDTVPTSLCSSDDAGTGTNTMAFTAH